MQYLLFLMLVIMIDIISCDYNRNRYKYSGYSNDHKATTPAPLPEWGYEDTDAWADDYPGCGGSKQSPIDIDTYSLNLDCPVTYTDEVTLKWKISTSNDTFRLLNNGKDLRAYPVYDYGDFGRSRGFLPLTSKRNTIARLKNNFVTDSGEHKQFCFDNIHFHLGLNNDKGSEHQINGYQHPLEAHFVHFSCDYDNLGDAVAASPEDPYVLAVVGVFFEIGDENKFIERLIQFSEYIETPPDDQEDATVQYEFNIKDMIPNKFADYYYYQGSLTTPGCLEAVQWHVLTDRMTVSARQMNYLRTYKNSDGDSLAPNWRPPQYNSGDVYLCSAKDSKPKGYKSRDKDRRSGWSKY